MKHIPGVDMSSGSLGQGLSAAVGMALAAKMSGKEYSFILIVPFYIFPFLKSLL